MKRSTCRILSVIMVFALVSPMFSSPPRECPECLEKNIKILKLGEKELDRMSGIYQSMFAMLSQAFEVKKDKSREALTAGILKINAARDSIGAKEEEINKRIEEAKDQFMTSCLLSAAQCISSLTAVAGEFQGNTMDNENQVNRFVLSYRNKLTRAKGDLIKLKSELKRLPQKDPAYPQTKKQKRDRESLMTKLKKIEDLLSSLNQKNKKNLNQLKQRTHVNPEVKNRLIRGTVTWSTTLRGAPGIHVRAYYHKPDGSRMLLGYTNTDERGYYSINYTSLKISEYYIDLKVECTDKARKFLVDSGLIRNAPPVKTVNLIIPN